MEIYCTGTAKIQHKNTGVIYEVEFNDLDWQCVGGDERSMGPENIYEAQVNHEHLGTLRWTISEYPVGAENFCLEDMADHSLLENFDYGLKHTPEFDSYEEWVDWNRPEDPLTIHTDSYYHTGDILADYDNHHSKEIVSRLVFAHQVSALEAYLSDTLINQVMNDDEALSRLLISDPELIKAKFTLTEILANEDFVKKKVRIHLRGLMYHNLAKVERLYKSTLGIEIFAPNLERNEIFKAIEYRHDCIHRNGFDKDGEKLEVFTKEYVQGIADKLQSMVNHVESQIRAK